MTNKTAFSAVISGRVQGVGFRYTCACEARRLGVSGWVKNAWDGSVAVQAEGTPEALAQFLAWLHNGPPHAKVDSIQTVPETPTGKYRDFLVKY